MPNPPVHWHEGMFLRPQHFQAAQRHWAQLVADHGRWDHAHNWGVRSLEIDQAALTNFRLVVRALQARLRDGTPVVISPEDRFPAVDLRPALARSSTVTVYLAVPLFHLGKANAAAEGPGDAARFLVTTAELPDENSGVNPQPIPLRRLHVKLLLSTDGLGGHEVLPLARLAKSPRAEATPEFDDAFFPPLLACDAWRALNGDVLQAVHDRIGKKIEVLADQVTARGASFDSAGQGDALAFQQLARLNEAYTTLGVLAFAQGVHPLQAYGELCRLAGKLAIFGMGRRPGEIAPYDHDDLARCFHQLKAQLDHLLDAFVEPAYRERPFIGMGLRMQVGLEPAWLEANWRLFLGVRSSLAADDCVRLLTRPGSLDMKIGSSDRVDAMYRQGGAGLRFSHVPEPPRDLPSGAGQVYLQIARDPRDTEWQHVQRALNLAVRVNESLIASDLQGQRVLHIRHEGGNVPLQFTLYVLGQ